MLGLEGILILGPGNGNKLLIWVYLGGIIVTHAGNN
jgi:hypothetical protein